MTNESEISTPRWLPRTRWLVLLTVLMVIPVFAISFYRYQCVCRWVEQRGWLGRESRYEIDWIPGLGDVVVYTNVEEVYLKRGTMNNIPKPAFKQLQAGEISRLRMFSQLEKLVIAGWQIPEGGIEEIASLQSLTEIDAVRSNITEEDARKLARKLPSASIRYAIDGNPHKNEKIMPRTTPSP